jgi:hypothetical protein
MPQPFEMYPRTENQAKFAIGVLAVLLFSLALTGVLLGLNVFGD